MRCPCFHSLYTAFLHRSSLVDYNGFSCACRRLSFKTCQLSWASLLLRAVSHNLPPMSFQNKPKLALPSYSVCTLRLFKLCLGSGDPLFHSLHKPQPFLWRATQSAVHYLWLAYLAPVSRNHPQYPLESSGTSPTVLSFQADAMETKFPHISQVCDLETSVCCLNITSSTFSQPVSLLALIPVRRFHRIIFEAPWFVHRIQS